MNLWPLVWRELGAEARSSGNYWARCLAAGFVMATTGAALWGYAVAPGRDGLALFSRMNVGVFVFLWFAVALLAADALSRERREGTLGLLMLTRLRPAEVVVAKGLVHGLRALGLLAAVAPVLAVPILMGGVTWREICRALLFDLSAVTLALATGLFVSACSERGTRAAAVALVAGGVAGGLFFVLHALQRVPFPVGVEGAGDAWVQYRQQLGWFLAQRTQLVLGWLMGRSGRDPWGGGFVGGRTDDAALLHALQLLLVSLLTGLVLVLLTGIVVRRVGRGEGVWGAWGWRRWSVESAIGSRLRRMRRRWSDGWLRRDPVGWYRRRQYSRMWVALGWLGVVAVLWYGAQAAGRGVLWAQGRWMLVALLAGMVAMEMLRAMADDFDSGFLEAVLCTPVKVARVVSSRIEVAVGGVLPAAVLVGGLVGGYGFGHTHFETVVVLAMCDTVGVITLLMAAGAVGLWAGICWGARGWWVAIAIVWGLWWLGRGFSRPLLWSGGRVVGPDAGLVALWLLQLALWRVCGWWSVRMLRTLRGELA